jgi:hypothetical protein
MTEITNATTEKKQKKITIYIPEEVIDQVKQSAKRYYRSFNGEVIFGLETYLTYFWKDANTPKRAA